MICLKRLEGTTIEPQDHLKFVCDWEEEHCDFISDHFGKKDMGGEISRWDLFVAIVVQNYSSPIAENIYGQCVLTEIRQVHSFLFLC
jgi:hypothetical protein